MAAAAAWGYALQNLAMRAVAPTVDPFMVALFAGLPTLTSALVLTLADRGRRERLADLVREAPGRRLLGGLALAGVAMYVIGNPIFVRALALGGAVVATPASSTVVIWSALLAALFLGEKLTGRAMLGVVVFVAGVVLLSRGQGLAVPVGPDWFWSIPLGVAAGLCWSSGSIGTRLAHARGIEPFTILTAYGVAGLGGILILVSVTGRLAAFAAWAASDPGATVTIGFLVLAGFLNLLSQVTLTLAFYYESVARASVISSSSVTIVAVLAWLFLGDALNITMFAGILVVFAGAVLVQSPGRGGSPASNLPNGRKNGGGSRKSPPANDLLPTA